MSNKQIVQEAVQKAFDGGWKPFIDQIEEWFVWELGSVTFMKTTGKSVTCAISQLVYDHDFAKALWGEESSNYDDLFELDNAPHYQAAWQYHLQQQVIAQDPIKYLGDNI